MIGMWMPASASNAASTPGAIRPDSADVATEVR